MEISLQNLYLDIRGWRVKQGQGLKALGGAHPYPNFPWITSPSLLLAPPPPTHNDGVGYPWCFLGVVVKVIGFTFPFPGANMTKIINKPTTSEPYWDQFDIKCICKVISVARSLHHQPLLTTKVVSNAPTKMAFHSCSVFGKTWSEFLKIGKQKLKHNLW